MARRLLFEKLESRQVFSGVTFSVIAQTNGLLGSSGLITGLEGDTSINDSGQVAFAGDLANGTSMIFAGTTTANTRALDGPRAGTASYNSPMISNPGTVAAARVSAPSSITKWNSNSPGTFVNVDVDSIGSTNPSISNDGRFVAYLYRDSNSTTTSLRLNGAQVGGPFFQGAIPPQLEGLIKPAVNNIGSIVTRGVRDTDSLSLYFATGGKLTIASAPNFTKIGVAPT